MIFALPGGILADRYGRKKIIVWGTFLRTLSPLIYFLAPSWEWIMLAAFFNGMVSIYMPAFTAIVADSMPESRRGTGYGVYSTITMMPNIFSPAVGGWVMDNYGYVEGLHTFLILQILVSLLMVAIRWRYTEETISKPTRTRRTFISKEIIADQSRPIQVMLLVAIVGSFSARLVMDFTNLYALEVVGLTNTQLGLISTAVGAFVAVFAFPSGMLSDRYGRKNNIMVARVTNPVTQWLVAFATDFNGYALARYVNGIAQAMGGGNQTSGGPSWNALIADIVPPREKGNSHWNPEHVDSNCRGSLSCSRRMALAGFQSADSLHGLRRRRTSSGCPVLARRERAK